MADPHASSPDPDDATIRISAPRPSLSGPGGLELPLPDELTALLPQDSYLVESFLGAGGMGAVYKGLQIRLNRPVAIKIMRRDIGRDHDFEERFRREALAMARLNHPNIINVIDYGEAGSEYLYIVMELVDGVDLMEVIRSGGMSQERAATLLPQICDALQFAHDNGIVHRDIKPGNIMLTRDGRVKMADFGLAKHFDTESGFRTQTGAGMGTPDYAAPEQFDPASAIDHRADIYALGVMIYQMITGHVPRGAWLPPSRRAAVDASWDGIVSRAMQNDPKDRYQKASEVKMDVSSIPLAAAREVASEARRAVSASVESPRTFAAQKRRSSFILLTTTAVVVLGLAAVFILLRPADPRPSVPVASSQPPAPVVSQALIPRLPDLPPLTLPSGGTGLVKEFAISGSGFLKQILVLPDCRRMLAFVDGTVGVVSLIDLETTRPVWSQSVRRGLFAVAMNRDGSRFATYHLVDADGTGLGSHAGAEKAFIELHETATGKLLQSWETPTSGEDIHYHFLALSPSGRSIVARIRSGDADASSFLRFEEGKAEVVDRWQAPTSHFGYTTHALDEEQYVSVGGSGTLLLSSNGKVEPLVPELAQYYGAISSDGQWLAATDSGRLALWNLKERKLARQFAESRASLQSLAFAGSDLIVMGAPKIAGAKTSQVLVWQVGTGALLARLPLARPGEYFDSLSTAGNGRFVALRIKHDIVPASGETNFVQIHRLPVLP